MLIIFPVILCLISVVVGGGGGVSGRRQGGGPALRFSPDGLPEWGYLSKLGLGFGCSGPFGCPWDLSGALFLVAL